MNKVIENSIKFLFIVTFSCVVKIQAETDLNCTILPQSPDQACCAIPALFDDNDLEKCSKEVKQSLNTSTKAVPSQNSSLSRPTCCFSNVSLNVTEPKPAANLTEQAEKCLQYECIAKTLKFINDENKFKSETLIKLLIKRLRNFRNEQWIHSISNAVEMCVEDVERNGFEIVETYNAAPFNITPDVCHPKHLALFQCIQIKTFINCPLVKFNQHEFCYDWKDYAIFCVKNFKNLPLIDLNRIL